MLKKLLTFCLTVLMILGVFTACGGKAPAETTPSTIAEPPAPTEPAEEAKVLKVLTLGHSLAVDTGHMLNLVAATEGIGEYEEILIGTLYYSGCKLSQHAKFLQENSPVYRLYISSTKTSQTPPDTMEEVTMEQAIRFEYWDIIVMQGGGGEIAAYNDTVENNIKIIQDYVNEHKLNPLATFAWHMPWVGPADEALLNTYPYTPNTHKDNYLKYNNDREIYFNALVTGTAQHIVTNDTFQFLIPTGTAMQNAWSSYMEEKDIHRDYAHATDMARVMTSYVWYCKLMGIDKLEELKLDAIPKRFLKSTANTSQDRILTDAEKAVMLESINNALANPLQMTQSQYTEAPTQ